MDWVAERDRVVARALDEGFAAAGVAGVRPFRRDRRRSLKAIDEGRLDGMPWLNQERVAGSADLRRRYPWARACLSLAWPYRPAMPLPRPASGKGAAPPRAEPGHPRGRMAAYACMPDADGAADYHDVLSGHCDRLVEWLTTEFPGARAKTFVDHGWAMDKPIAQRAGVGFAGKNTTLITQAAGSYVVLADLLVSLPLPATPVSRRGCGSCRACLPACPTGALLAPGVMDARRCISYLTIEHRGPIPEDMRPLMGTWIFGCDLCMEACPINHRLAPEAHAAGSPTTDRGPVPYPDLVECLELSQSEFDARFRGTAVWRAGRAGLSRNAAIALGNAGDPAAVPALRRAAFLDTNPAVRDAAGWSLARLGAVVSAG